MKPHLPKATLVPFLIVVFAGPTLPQELITAEELFSKGLELAVKSRDYKKALPYLEETVKKNPRHTEAWSYVGYCYGQLGEYKKAVEAYKKVTEIQPASAQALSNLGLAYFKLGLTQEAIRASKQAIRIKPDLAEAHHNLGMAYSKLGRYREAVQASKQAVRFKPNYAEAHCILGVSYLLLGNRGSALQEYQVLKDLDKDLASMLDDLLKKDENDRAKHEKQNLAQ